MEKFRIMTGKCLPMGASVTPEGVNFSLFSRNGTRVILELYENENDSKPAVMYELSPENNKTGDIWHIFVEGLKAGALYMYRVYGPFEPSKGHRFDGKQVLFDPYAKAMTAVPVFKNLPKGYTVIRDKMDIDLEKEHSLSVFPKCVVVDDKSYDWEGDKPLGIPLCKSIIYETHLKGFTASPSSEVEHSGTYKGLIEKLPYIKDLGVTSVELLPIFEFDETENSNTNPRTGEKLKNFWGYNTISFFAPKASYAFDKRPGACVNEFKDLVKAFHKEGIEIILDVVFNHTAEGNENGVMLNFRGLDNSIFYHLVNDHREYYLNFSGCGNALNCNNPVVVEFVIECLRYWVLEMHIDGFRFDLASVLGRGQNGEILQKAPLLDSIAQDPVLHNTKVIAEPWDAAGAYQVGSFFGDRWCEWNDRYRDDIRRFWRGDDYVATQAATRISGSSDLYASSGRRPFNSINFVTCHDGFTLNDVVSYDNKHNEQNGENNRDGSDNNNSYNNGYEGVSANPVIERNRFKQVRNFILTLFISQGTPMLLAGDEFRRTQFGNNNAYCQDNEISWLDWALENKNKNLVEFTKRAIALRKKHPVFRRSDFFRGFRGEGNKSADICWYTKDGTMPDWSKVSHFLAFRLNGECAEDFGYPADNDFYVMANTSVRDEVAILPVAPTGTKWYRVADTSIDSSVTGCDAICLEGSEEYLNAQKRYVVPSLSLVILMAK
ncbi:MAG: glycogen debranching protein GlgX [Treponema sp.]|nr:glycogen debranching protein GlgX [Treponema sp.]